MAIGSYLEVPYVLTKDPGQQNAGTTSEDTVTKTKYIFKKCHKDRL